MSGPLCDAVLEESGSAAMLESLARSNLFLVALDRHGEWYRYHHLFQDLLRSELVRAEPDLMPELLERAAGWCEANQQPEAAIGYAQAAGDVDRVARLVERCTMPAYQSGRVATAERWLDWLEGRGALERNAAVAVLAGLVTAIWGRPAEAERWAEAAERATYEGTLSDGSQSIDSWLALLRAMRCRQGAARMRADAELATPNACPAEPVPPDSRAAARDRGVAGRRGGPSRRPVRRRRRGGIELGGARAGGGGARRARSDRDRARRLGPGRGARGPGASGHPRVRGWTSTPPARSPMRLRRASRSTAATPRAPRSSSPERSACGRG